MHKKLTKRVRCFGKKARKFLWEVKREMLYLRNASACVPNARKLDEMPLASFKYLRSVQQSLGIYVLSFRIALQNRKCTGVRMIDADILITHDANLMKYTKYKCEDVQGKVVFIEHVSPRFEESYIYTA